MEGSTWINGMDWMSGPRSKYPVSTIDEIKLTNTELIEANKEKLKLPTQTFYNKNDMGFNKNVDNEIKKRYDFSKYLIDPNRFRFIKVVRIMALVVKFIKKLSKNLDRVQKLLFTHNKPGEIAKFLQIDENINNDMTKSAMYYFSQKATQEVKKFLEKRKYINVTKEIDGVLYYTGRILNDSKFGGYPQLCSAALDLCPTQFCVPVIDPYSRVAIAIAMEIHWYHPDVKHTGIESIMRQTLNVAHIIEGRPLAKSIKRICTKCRILYKNSVEVAMGPLQNENLCIAPAFYASQIDIFGPYKAYSIANKKGQPSKFGF